MGGEGAAECVSILSLLDPLPWDVMPLLRHGGGGRPTEVVCGYLHSEDPLFEPTMRALPPVFVVPFHRNDVRPVSAGVTLNVSTVAPVESCTDTVSCDVPAGATAVGTPARIIQPT